MKGDGNDAMDMTFDEAPDYLFNVTVWENVASLLAFVYRTLHVEFLKKRHDWFAPQAKATTVLCWVPVGHRPDIPEAWSKLQVLRANGPTAEAFTFQKRFDAPPS